MMLGSSTPTAPSLAPMSTKAKKERPSGVRCLLAARAEEPADCAVASAVIVSCLLKPESCCTVVVVDVVQAAHWASAGHPYSPAVPPDVGDGRAGRARRYDWLAVAARGGREEEGGFALRREVARQQRAGA